MNDIIRFLISRSPQQKVPSGERRFNPFVPAFGAGLISKEEATVLGQDARFQQTTAAIGVSAIVLTRQAAPATKRQAADAIWASPLCLKTPDSTPLESILPALDEWLRSHADKPRPDALEDQLKLLATEVAARSIAGAGSSPLKTILLDPLFWVDWQRITASLAVNFHFNSQDVFAVNLRGQLVRYLLLGSLLDSLVATNGLASSANAVHKVLHKSRLLLPAGLLAHLKRTNPSIRKPAFTDLFVVRERWKSYEAGEIAHIENILPHELKERIHERLDESEEITREESFRSEISQKDSESTDRFELQETASQEFQAALNVDFSTDTSIVAPGVVNDTHIGGGADVSYAQAASRASQTSREVITRTLNRIQSDVSKMRQMRTLTRVTQRNRHELKNEGEKAIAGVYRWLDKIKQVQLVRYPNRFVIELQIPEPGAWIRWVLTRREMASDLPLNPGPFPQLEPQSITFHDEGALTDYRHLAARYEARGVQPPPGAMKLATTVLLDPDANEKLVKPDVEGHVDIPAFKYYTNNSLTVPAGWLAKSWTASLAASDKTSEVNVNVTDSNVASLRVLVGETQNYTGNFNYSEQRHPAHIDGPLTGTVGNISNGVVPIAVEAKFVLGYAINITVTCEPAPETVALWQMETLQAVREGHARKYQRYLDAKALQETTQGITIGTLPPAQARQLVINELKRQAIQFLIGGDFPGRGACIKRDPQTSEPSPDLAITSQFAPEIQFLESAFEWSNLSWMLYPYYWAARGNWPALALNQSADPDFDAFLNAGSSRVTLAVRKGFEAQAQLYLDYGILWGGGAMPSPDDPNYLSVAEEIREMQVGATDGEVVDQWDVRLPTTLLLLDTDVAFPLKNPAVR